MIIIYMAMPEECSKSVDGGLIKTTREATICSLSCRGERFSEPSLIQEVDRLSAQVLHVIMSYTTVVGNRLEIECFVWNTGNLSRLVTFVIIQVSMCALKLFVIMIKTFYEIWKITSQNSLKYQICLYGNKTPLCSTL